MLFFRTHTFLYVLLPIFISTLSFTATDKVKDLSSWTELGTVTVSEGTSYDILEVPEQQEQVKYLKVKVLKSTVYVKALKVMYSDKTSEYHSISNPLKKVVLRLLLSLSVIIELLKRSYLYTETEILIVMEHNWLY